jgi:hypothetical protein
VRAGKNTPKETRWRQVAVQGQKRRDRQAREHGTRTRMRNKGRNAHVATVDAPAPHPARQAGTRAGCAGLSLLSPRNRQAERPLLVFRRPCTVCRVPERVRLIFQFDRGA